MKLSKFLFVALTFMVMAFFRGNVAAYNMAEYFPLNQGDEKTYLVTVKLNEGRPLTMLAKYVINGTELINEVETIRLDNMPFSRTNRGFRFVMDSEGLKMYKRYRGEVGLIYVFEPPYLALPAQFDVGESYETPYLLSSHSVDDGTLMDSATGSVIHSLDLVEDVTVPGDTFKDCLKNALSVSWQSSAGVTGSVEETYWLARGLGWVKLSTTEYIQYPDEYPDGEDTKSTMTIELISATVDGVHYGCPATFALGGDARGNDLNALRKFRDGVLSKTSEGREIIKLYYQWSSAIVKAMEEDEEFKEEVKEMVDGVLPLIRGAVE